MKKLFLILPSIAIILTIFLTLFSFSTQAMAVADPSRYGIDVIQVGGIGSHTLTKDAFYLEERGYLNPPENYMNISFNTPGDLMWVSCKGGYNIESANSPTNNQYTIDPINGVGVTIEDKLKNSITVICTTAAVSSASSTIATNNVVNSTSSPVTNNTRTTWLAIIGVIIFILILGYIWENRNKNKIRS
jgi:hypothetical protein